MQNQRESKKLPSPEQFKDLRFVVDDKSVLKIQQRDVNIVNHQLYDTDIKNWNTRVSNANHFQPNNESAHFDHDSNIHDFEEHLVPNQQTTPARFPKKARKSILRKSPEHMK